MDFRTRMLAEIAILTALFDTAQAENRDFTEEEQAKYDAAEQEHKRLKAAFDKSEALKVLKDGLPAEVVQEIVVPASNAKAQSMQASAGDNREAKRPYASLGNVLIDVASTKNNVAVAQERLVKAGLSTEVGSDGGFLIPDEHIGSMLGQAESESVLYPKTTTLTTKGNSVSIPSVKNESRADGSRFGGISVNWVREGEAGSRTAPEFVPFELKLSKIMGLVSVTSEMLEDATLLNSWVNMAFPAEMAFVMDQAIFNSDGNGLPLGIMNSNALVTVAKEGSQAANTIVYPNLIKMWARMPAKRMSRAAWYVTQQALEQFPLMNLAVGTGGAPVFLPAGGASAAPFGTLLGRPVIPLEQASALGDKGDIVLADMSDYLTITKGGLKTASSIHVDFEKDKELFRFTRRMNGAPYTKTKLQSKANSAFYTSPYITLAERA